MPDPDYITSDIHLGAVPTETERAFLSFLEHVGSHAASLLIAGDLFDFWFEYGTVIPGRHFRVLAALADLVDAGIPVTMAGGNHDAWGGRFLEQEVGLVFHRQPFKMSLGGRRALVAHGDGLGSGDLKYRALKAVLRSRAAILGFRALHPELGMRIAHAVSSTSAKADDDARARSRAAFIERWAANRLAEDETLAWVVCGHTHVPAIREVAPDRYYINAGDWITHHTYVTVPAGAPPELHRWCASGPPSR